MFEPLPSTQPPGKERPQIKMEEFRWELDTYGFKREYDLSRTDALRLLPTKVSYIVNNAESEDLKAKSIVKISEETLCSRDVLLPAKSKKKIECAEGFVFLKEGTSKNHKISLNLEVEKAAKHQVYTVEDSFQVHLHHGHGIHLINLQTGH